MPGRSYTQENQYRYGFSGKELDPEGMGGGLTTYDYGFRIYNPAIAKFLSVDPLAASYPWYTPYQIAGNKPVWKIDVDGLEEGNSEANSADESEPPKTITQKDSSGNLITFNFDKDLGSYVLSEVELGSSVNISEKGYSGFGRWLRKAKRKVSDWLKSHEFVLETKLDVKLSAGVGGKFGYGKEQAEWGLSAVDIELLEWNRDWAKNENSKIDYIMKTDPEKGIFYPSMEVEHGLSIEYGNHSVLAKKSEVIEFYNDFSATKWHEEPTQFGYQYKSKLENPNANSIKDKNLNDMADAGTFKKPEAADKCKYGKFKGIEAGMGGKLILGIEFSFKIGWNKK